MTIFFFLRILSILIHTGREKKVFLKTYSGVYPKRPYTNDYLCETLVIFNMPFSFTL